VNDCEQVGGFGTVALSDKREILLQFGDPLFKAPNIDFRLLSWNDYPPSSRASRAEVES
jgi:hypothetical protein